MSEKESSEYCFLIRNGNSCIKTKVAKQHLPYYECEKCIWRIRSEDPKHLASLQKIFEKYGKRTWE